MSETPRTDSVAAHFKPTTWQVSYEGMEALARELERELAKAHAANQSAAAAALRDRDALQAIADEAVQHHEHNPISGVDRLPQGYVKILNLATAALQ